MGENGFSLFTVLGIVFTVLKLVGVINWSWWLVLLPFYGVLAILGIALLIVGLVMYIKDKLL